MGLAVGVLGQLLQVGGREAGDADAMGMQGLPGFFGGPQAVVAHHQPAAAEQGGQPAFLGTVEGEGHDQQLACVAVHVVALGDGLAVHADLPVGHGHALGLAGGARGVDQVGQVIRIQTGGRTRFGLCRQRYLIQFDHARRPGCSEAIPQAVLGDQHRHGRVFDNPLQAVFGVVDVQRYVGAAGFHHREEGDDDLHRALQGDTDADFRADTLSDQVMGQAIGPVVQLPVRQL
ncbi:hypothetical protein D9M71_252470 [compost metagenome]